MGILSRSKNGHDSLSSLLFLMGLIETVLYQEKHMDRYFSTNILNSKKRLKEEEKW